MTFPTVYCRSGVEGWSEKPNHVQRMFGAAQLIGTQCLIFTMVLDRIEEEPHKYVTQVYPYPIHVYYMHTVFLSLA